MVKVISTRAKKILDAPSFFKTQVTPPMRKFPGDEISLWVDLEGEFQTVKNLSFSGELESIHILILESMASLLIGKKVSILETLSVRECEAFLRDRNSLPAFEGWGQKEEQLFHSVFQWIRAWPFKNFSQNYSYSKDKGPFRLLRLAEKVRELKSFLTSAEISILYQKTRLPELVDVEELTVFVNAPYSSEADRQLFQKLHERGVDVFNEEELNFIPES
jgi:hypothetical protein